MDFLHRTDMKNIHRQLLSLCIVAIIYLKNDTAAERQPITIDDAPQNLALLQNQTATFTCHVTQSSSLDVHGIVVFKEAITSAIGRTISYDDRVVYKDLGGDVTRHVRYGVIKISRHSFRLEVSPVTAEDAGKYICRSRNAETVTKSAELVMLEDNPECYSNSTDGLDLGETIMMWCVVTSRGRWAPTIHFSNNRDDVIIQNETIWENPHINARTVRFTATKVVDENDHNTVFTALTYFENPVVTVEDEASNTPLYTYAYQFTPLTVKQPGLEPFTDSDVISTSHNVIEVKDNGGSTVVSPGSKTILLTTQTTVLWLYTKILV